MSWTLNDSLRSDERVNKPSQQQQSIVLDNKELIFSQNNDLSKGWDVQCFIFSREHWLSSCLLLLQSCFNISEHLLCDCMHVGIYVVFLDNDNTDECVFYFIKLLFL